MTSVEIRRQGWLDHKQGKKLTQNPYREGKARNAWITGWYAARNDQPEPTA